MLSDGIDNVLLQSCCTGPLILMVAWLLPSKNLEVSLRGEFG
jgi:hypothetical protein